MSEADWSGGYSRCLGCLLRGESLNVNDRGETISGDTLLMLFNADHALAIEFSLPRVSGVLSWSLAFDTFSPETPARSAVSGDFYRLQPCSLAVLTASPVLAATANEA